MRSGWRNWEQSFRTKEEMMMMMMMMELYDVKVLMENSAAGFKEQSRWISVCVWLRLTLMCVCAHKKEELLSLFLLFFLWTAVIVIHASLHQWGYKTHIYPYYRLGWLFCFYLCTSLSLCKTSQEPVGRFKWNSNKVNTGLTFTTD